MQRTKRITLAAVALSTVAALLPSHVASAGIRQELDAADAVEAKLARKHRKLSWIVSCRTTGTRRFSCDIVGSGNDRFASGRATVRKTGRYAHRVRIVSLNFS